MINSHSYYFEMYKICNSINVLRYLKIVIKSNKPKRIKFKLQVGARITERFNNS